MSFKFMRFVVNSKSTIAQTISVVNGDLPKLSFNSIIPFCGRNEELKIKESLTSARRNDNYFYIAAVRNKCNLKINELAGHVLGQFEILFRNSIRIFFEIKRLIVYPLRPVPDSGDVGCTDDV